MLRRARCAFTRIDLLVAVGVVLFLLWGLFVPAIHGPREKKRDRICLSNMRQVALAIQQYESISPQSYYPGYRNYLRLSEGSDYVALKSPYPAAQIGKPVAVSWVVELFPYLDQVALHKAFSSPVSKLDTTRTDDNAPHRWLYNYLETLVCPSDPPADFKRAPLSFVVNTGMRDGPIMGKRDYRENGVFHDHYSDHPDSPTGRLLSDPRQQVIEKVNSNFIANRGDGLQYTLMLSENVDAGSYLDTDERFLGFTWAMPTEPVNKDTWTVNPPANFRYINQNIGELDISEIEDPQTFQMQQQQSKGNVDEHAPYYYSARPSSVHPNGVNVVFCDGHAVFMSDKIDYYVYCLLMTPRGKDLRDPATGERIKTPGFAGELGPLQEERWLNR